jgi:predicted component of type VI protein secretion system
MAFVPHSLSPAEHKALLDAERRAEPFLVYRDGLGDLRFTYLGERERLVIGRVAGSDVVLDWDGQVSRSHAQLERFGTDWTLVDDGLSRNGSHVNGERLASRRRLTDGDVVRIGQTTIVFRAPSVGFDSTQAEFAAPLARLTVAERRVLVALCAPLLTDGAPAPAPATNREIADALSLSLDGVKTHVRSLFTKLGVGDLPQYQKRTDLASRAVSRGLVTRADVS